MKTYGFWFSDHCYALAQIPHCFFYRVSIAQKKRPLLLAAGVLSTGTSRL
jgi:hypothetical protein